MERIINAFFNSVAGLKHVLRTETAVKQEAVVLAIALPAVFFVTSSAWMRLLLIGLIVLVLVVELLNTAIEILCDHVRPEIHPQIKIIKDLGSAAVLLTSTIAGIAWVLALWDRFS